MKKLQVEGWKVEKLGNVVEFQRGLTYSKKDEVVESSNIVLRANNVDLNTNMLDFTELKYIKESIEIPKEKIVTKGSLIICTASGSKSHLGKVALIDDNYGYAFGGFMGQITPKQNLDSKFLFYRMISDEYKDFISKLSDGANINNLRFNDLAEFEIPVPPLPEQQRIVTLLDETFAGLAQVHANAERNLLNAREVFEAATNEIFGNPGEEWEEKTIEDIADIEYGYTDKAKSSGKFRYIRITDIDKNGNLIPEDKMYVGNFKEADNFLLQDGDLLMARTGATFAKVLLYEDFEPSVFASYLIRIKFSEKILNKLYWYFSKSKLYWDQANQLSSGSAQPQFNGGALKQVVFPYPKSLEEQRAIVQRLDGLAAETSRLEAVYQSKLEAVEELRKSVLGKAFAGGL